MRTYTLPWCVNSLALEAVQYLLSPNDAIDRFVASTRVMLNKEKKAIYQRLSGIPGIRLFPSVTGFFLLQLPDPHRSKAVCEQLAQEKILVRDCANFKGLSDRFIRISLQDKAKNQQCAKALEAIFSA